MFEKLDSQRFLALLSLGIALGGCNTLGVGDREERVVGCDDNGPQYERFCSDSVALTACTNPSDVGDFGGCIPGYLPSSDTEECADNPEECLHSTYYDMNQSERDGLAAWTLFSGDGTWLRELTKATQGGVNALRLLDYPPADMRDGKIVDRDQRFDTYGPLNDPSCRRNNAGPDEFGLWLDECDDPYSTGILGFRLKPNPEFNKDLWEQIGGARGHFADRKKTFRITDTDGRRRSVYGWEIEPPYLPSMACTSCHVAPHPLNPPEDIHNPKWDEVAFALGNQFFREGSFLGYFVEEEDFTREVVDSQPPGTSDTSRVATDHIFNPNVINGIANLDYRPVFKTEVTPGTYNPDRIACDHPAVGGADAAAGDRIGTVGDVLNLLRGVANGDIEDPRSPDGECAPMARVLKMGGDSSGPTGALLRVYVNVGSCTDQFMESLNHPFTGADHLWEPGAINLFDEALINDKEAIASAEIQHGFFNGIGQAPISRKDLQLYCSEYQDMSGRVIDTFNYLTFVKPYNLQDAPGGAQLIEQGLEAAVAEFPETYSSKEEVLEAGAKAFARNCATCHSSVQPATDLDPAQPFDAANPDTWYTEARTAFFEELVAQPDFLSRNYLSDDVRYPVDVLGTNYARAMGTNAMADRVWAEYSSETYKNLPTVVMEDISISLWPGSELTLDTVELGGGRGYLRTASLINVWSSAPFLHNNGLGLYNGDYSVEGRLEAYEDAMAKLMGLAPRDGEATIRRTKNKTTLHTAIFIQLPWLPDPEITVPVPTGSLIDWRANLGALLGRGDANEPSILQILLGLFEGILGIDGPTKEILIENFGEAMAATDAIQDKGHEFGLDLSEAEKRALIEYMKRM